MMREKTSDPVSKQVILSRGTLNDGCESNQVIVSCWYRPHVCLRYAIDPAGNGYLKGSSLKTGKSSWQRGNISNFDSRVEDRLCTQLRFVPCKELNG